MADSPRPETIKFDQAFDQTMRNKALKVHGVAKAIRVAGFPIKTLAANLRTDSTRNVRQQFGLKVDNNCSMIEFLDKGDDDNQKIVDWMMTSGLPIKILDNKIYDYKTTKVFRVLIEYTGQ
jgi:hypothetical protein